MRARGLPITFPTGSPAEKDNDPGQERSLPCSFPTLSYLSSSFLNSFRVENPCSVHPISEVKVRQPWSEHDLRLFPLFLSFSLSLSDPSPIIGYACHSLTH